MQIKIRVIRGKDLSHLSEISQARPERAREHKEDRIRNAA